MFIDGDPVFVGDRVYHVTMGYGKVVTLEKNNARIQMDIGGIMNMRDGGYVGLRRQFYWYEPVSFRPRKGKEEKQKRAMTFAEAALELWEKS